MCTYTTSSCFARWRGGYYSCTKTTGEGEDVVLVSVFNPPLHGTERHTLDGASGSCPEHSVKRP
ncbi:hypothetical protein DF040_02505 [Burkholderia cenocepacia]|nr:hypothetical protein DF040_02505 [Burkholderia cenocepacia]